MKKRKDCQPAPGVFSLIEVALLLCATTWRVSGHLPNEVQLAVSLRERMVKLKGVDKGVSLRTSSLYQNCLSNNPVSQNSRDVATGASLS